MDLKDSQSTLPYEQSGSEEDSSGSDSSWDEYFDEDGPVTEETIKAIEFLYRLSDGGNKEKLQKFFLSKPENKKEQREQEQEQEQEQENKEKPEITKPKRGGRKKPAIKMEPTIAEPPHPQVGGKKPRVQRKPRSTNTSAPSVTSELTSFQTPAEAGETVSKKRRRK